MAGQVEAAATSITRPSKLAWVAEALACGGLHERAAAVAAKAEAMARSITSPRDQEESLKYVAMALTASGQFQRAEAAARSITDQRAQAEALAKMAETLTRAGQLERAEAVARSITDSDKSAWVLEAVAEALAGAGQYQQAEAVASSITDPYAQAKALARLAEALTETGETRAACRIAATAGCDTCTWTTAARAVFLLNPSAVTVLARMLVGTNIEADIPARLVSDDLPSGEGRPGQYL